MIDDPATTEPAAELMLSPQWLLRLYGGDLALICRALGDRMTDDDLEAARALGDRLTALQQLGASQLAKGRDAAVTNMARARERDGLPADPLRRRA